MTYGISEMQWLPADSLVSTQNVSGWTSCKKSNLYFNASMVTAIIAMNLYLQCLSYVHVKSPKFISHTLDTICYLLIYRIAGNFRWQTWFRENKSRENELGWKLMMSLCAYVEASIRTSTRDYFSPTAVVLLLSQLRRPQHKSKARPLLHKLASPLHRSVSFLRFARGAWPSTGRGVVRATRIRENN